MDQIIVHQSYEGHVSGQSTIPSDDSIIKDKMQAVTNVRSAGSTTWKQTFGAKQNDSYIIGSQDIEFNIAKDEDQK